MNKKSLYFVTAVAALTIGGGVWQGAMRPASAQKELVTSRDARVDGKTVGEVLIKGKPAIRFTNGAGALSAVERADLVAGRLNRLDEDKPLKASELRVVTAGSLVTITARGTDIVTVTAEDGRASSQSARDTADSWVQNLSDAISGRPISENALRGKAEPVALSRDGDRRGDDRDLRNDAKGEKPARSAADDDDFYPELKKKIVPIISAGSNLNIGVAQVQGEERDVDRCKAVAQLETDWKDRARIKILVPVAVESVKHIDRVPGVAVSAIADYKIQD